MHNITAIEPKVRGPTKAKGTRHKIEPASRLLVVDTSRTKSVQGRGPNENIQDEEGRADPALVQQIRKCSSTF